jgi:hypothetical protein
LQVVSRKIRVEPGEDLPLLHDRPFFEQHVGEATGDVDRHGGRPARDHIA